MRKWSTKKNKVNKIIVYPKHEHQASSTLLIHDIVWKQLYFIAALIIWILNREFNVHRIYTYPDDIMIRENGSEGRKREYWNYLKPKNGIFSNQHLNWIGWNSFVFFLLFGSAQQKLFIGICLLNIFFLH